MTKKGLKTSAYRVAVLALVAGLVFSILASITFGNADISIKEVYRVIFYEIFHIDALSEYSGGAVHDVVCSYGFPEFFWLLR